MVERTIKEKELKEIEQMLENEEYPEIFVSEIRKARNNIDWMTQNEADFMNWMETVTSPTGGFGTHRITYFPFIIMWIIFYLIY